MENPSTPFLHRKKGIILLIVPFLTTVITIIIFSFFNTVFSTTGGVTLTAINNILKLIGVLSAVVTIIGIPIGIYFLGKRTRAPGTYDERSGKRGASEIPPEIQGWSWGASGLTWIWGLYHGVWISLLNFAPLIGIFFWIILGFNGNEWAWKKGQWKDVEEFKKAQKAWKPWGIAVFALRLLFILAIIIAIPYSSTSKQTNKNIPNSVQLQESTKDKKKSVVSGSEIDYKIHFNPKKWTVTKKMGETASEYEFTHTDETVGAVVIPGESVISLEEFKEIITEVREEISPDAEIISENKISINGKKVVIFKRRHLIEDAFFTYCEYAYAGEEGTLRVITFTEEELFLEYEKDIQELFNGIEIGK